MNGEFSGALTQRVIVQRRAATRDDLGGASGAWTTIATVWAGISPVTPASWGAGDLPAAAPRWTATIRAGADVAIGDRLQWRGLLFAVRAIAADPAMPDRLTIVLEEDR
jgi:head-tail adaptor